MVLKTAAALLLVLGFFVAGNSGLAHIGMDDMAMHEAMPGCSLMGMSAVCQMNPLEHIGMWQNLFAFLPKIEDLFALLFSLFALVLGMSWLSWLPRRIPKTGIGHRIRQDYIALSHPLQELFSSGILNPKLF